MRPNASSSDVTRHVANAAELPSPALVGSSEWTVICTPDTVLQATYMYVHLHEHTHIHSVTYIHTSYPIQKSQTLKPPNCVYIKNIL